jgi:hypothetical protein
MNTSPPINFIDLEKRKELIEGFVFSDNKSFILTNELKKMSKFYVPEKIEFKFITLSTGQLLTLF